MSLLVEYSLLDGKYDDQVEALKTLVAGLKAEGCETYSYTGFATEDPLKFIAVFDFEDDAGKNAFLATKAFAHYRDTASTRFTGPPSTTTITKIASTVA
jgi:quinol monooxygenase YgiN